MGQWNLSHGIEFGTTTESAECDTVVHDLQAVEPHGIPDEVSATESAGVQIELRECSISQIQVMATDGHALGRAQGVLIDLHAGRVAYLLLNIDRSDEAIPAVCPIPWSAMDIDTHTGQITLNYSKAELEAALQLVGKRKYTMLEDLNLARQVHTYFGVTPYWE